MQLLGLSTHHDSIHCGTMSGKGHNSHSQLKRDLCGSGFHCSAGGTPCQSCHLGQSDTTWQLPAELSNVCMKACIKEAAKSLPGSALALTRVWTHFGAVVQHTVHVSENWMQADTLGTMLHTRG